jgi:superfamily II DNA or RNA helicase
VIATGVTRVAVRRALELAAADLSPAEVRRVRDAFTHQNLERERRDAAGHPSGGLDLAFRTWSMEGGVYLLPRGGTRQLAAALGAEPAWEDLTARRPAEWPEREGDLWGFQGRAARALLWGRQGVLLGPCGSGKTEVLLAAAALSGQRTLAVVDTRDLQRQWADRFLLRHPSAAPGDLGLVGGCASADDGYDWGRAARGPGRVLTVATAQTLRGLPEAECLDLHGCFVADEVHVWAAETFSAVAGRSPSAWRLGGTATLRRADGLVESITDHFGPVLAEVTEADLEAAGVRIPVRVALVRSAFRAPRGARDWDGVLKSMIADRDRADLCLRTALAAAAEGPTAVLSERRAFGALLAHRMTAAGVRTHTLFGGAAGRPADCLSCGRVPETEDAPGRRCPGCGAARLSRGAHNEEVIARLRDGRLRAAVGTSVADKGLDVPALSRAVVVLPSAGGRGKELSARLIQQRGRLSRPWPGKADAVLYYVYDHLMPSQRERAGAIRREVAGVIEVGPDLRTAPKKV